MQASTKSRLTSFSRLWAVSTVLFFVLCIVAVIACMNDLKSLMALAVMGTILLLIIQLCQLIAALIVRRWWYALGCVIGIAISLFTATCSIVALAAGQYRPPVRYDEESGTDSIETIISTEALTD